MQQKHFWIKQDKFNLPAIFILARKLHATLAKEYYVEPIPSQKLLKLGFGFAEVNFSAIAIGL